MARQEIDLTTPQPNGKMGEPTKSAWEKVNDMTEELYTKSAFKGSNGTWEDNIPVANDLFENVKKLRSWNNSSANIPLAGTFGVVTAWSSNGGFVKENGNWISMVGWGTNGTMFFTISVNGAQFIPWRRIWNSGNTTVDSNGFIKAI